MELILLLALVFGGLSVVLLFFYLKFCYWPFQVLKRNGICGPTPSFFYGNYKQRTKAGGGIVHYEALSREYGDIVGYYIGQKPFVLLSDLELIRLITVKDFDSFRDRHDKPNLLSEKYKLKGLLYDKGEVWKQARQILSPTFSSFKMKAMTPIIKNSVDILVDVFQKRADTNKSFDIISVYESFTMETIVATAFGRVIDIQKGQSDALTEAANEVIAGFHDKSGNNYLFLTMIISNFPWLEPILRYYVNHSGNAFIKAFQVLNEVSELLIEDRRKECKRKANTYKDLLQLMIDATVENSEKKLTDHEIASQAITFLVAGYDTTANTLNYASYLLAVNPDVQQKLQADIDEYFEGDPEVSLYEAAKDLEYLEMVVLETLRIYPPAPMFGRQCTKEYHYKDITFPKGCHIGFNIPTLHKDPKYWKEPKKFDPLRFSAEEKAKRPNLCFMPFGSGPRSCIGMRLAMLESKLALIGILRRFSFQRAPDTQVPLKIIVGFTTAPADPLYLKVIPR